MQALEKAIGDLEKAGFTHIKMELEGQTGRRVHRTEWTCTDCHGKGISVCSACNGTGAVSNTSASKETYVECKTCHGASRGPCMGCGGSGSLGNFGQDEVCGRFMLDYVARKLYGKTLVQMEKESKKLDYKAIPLFNYASFYFDGSVDSEFTFTIPLKESKRLPVVVEAFKAMAQMMKTRIDVDGAGLHTAVLHKDCNGVYPRNASMPSPNINNFSSEMQKLMPALFFLGTSGPVTRGLRFRLPRVSRDKYSAIHIVPGGFEFRVFDTCYKNPEAVFDIVQVIANAIQFYADPNKKVKPLGMEFEFDESRNIASYFNNIHDLRALNATVKYLKPMNKTFKQLRLERHVTQTIKVLESENKKVVRKLKDDYKRYVDSWQTLFDRPLSNAENTVVEELMAYDNDTREVAENRVRQGRQHSKITFEVFEKRHARRKQNVISKVMV
jgi:hypothetical protein